MSKVFSTSDVASHNKPEDLYLTIDEDVYDLTAFADEHPGAPSFSLPQSISADC
jgi:cytochrome b involved in lipid metabolism